MTPLTRKELVATELASFKILVPAGIRRRCAMSWLARAGVGVAGIAVMGTLTTGVALGYVINHAAVNSTGAAGTATAKDDRQTVTVAGATATGALMFPGGPAGDLNFTVTNSNPRPLSITALSLTASGNTTACALTLGTVTTPITISAVNGASQPVSLAGVLTMGNAAAASCMNQSALNVPLTLTVHD